MDKSNKSAHVGEIRRSNNVREGGRENRGCSGGGEHKDGEAQRVHFSIDSK